MGRHPRLAPVNSLSTRLRLLQSGQTTLILHRQSDAVADHWPVITRSIAQLHSIGFVTTLCLSSLLDCHCNYTDWLTHLLKTLSRPHVVRLFCPIAVDACYRYYHRWHGFIKGPHFRSKLDQVMSDLKEVKFFSEQIESHFADNYRRIKCRWTRGAAVDAANMGIN